MLRQGKRAWRLSFGHSSPFGARTEKVSAGLEPATSTIVFASTLDRSRRVNPTSRYDGCLARFRDQHAQLACAATSCIVQFQDRTTEEASFNGAFSSLCSNSPTDIHSYLFIYARLQFQFFEWDSIGTPERSWWVYFKGEVPKLAEMGVTIVWLPRECTAPRGVSRDSPFRITDQPLTEQ